MVNPWAFPEAIALIDLLKTRYLNFDSLGKNTKKIVSTKIKKCLGIRKFKLDDFEECFSFLSAGTISKASFVHS